MNTIFIEPTVSKAHRWLIALIAVSLCFFHTDAHAQDVTPRMAGDLVDVSEDFQRLGQVYFAGARVTDFNVSTGEGSLQWDRYMRQPSLSFNKIDLPLVRAEAREFPGTEYDRDPVLPFSISFVSPRTVRLQFSSRERPLGDGASLMLDGPVPTDDSWEVAQTDSTVAYTSEHGQVRLTKDPWQIAFYDEDGKLLTRTMSLGDPATFSTPIPFSFVRRSRDLGRSFAASFSLSHDEKIFGGGESFTRLNKRGQKMILYLRDAMGAQSRRMYKPIPFFLSSEGYGVFVHTSAPVTFDFGHAFDQYTTLYTGDETLDLFVFLGEPKDVLSEYTALTGRSPVPPLWSFGLWMSRITYRSEEQVRDVAAQLRAYRIPSDVIHLDTGWFETEWRNDYRFAASRFSDPADMIADLSEQGFHISLWQLPYFTPKNELYDEIVRKGYTVTNRAGNRPFLDAVLDFSNPEAVEWYKGKLAGLLEMGVGAIKADFGENAPRYGQYASGRTGYYEHNLYPLCYNEVVSDVTKAVAGYRLIWARSAWAGSQRYPVHWGGDAENTNSAMAATLRAGLSFGLSGFTYWSHDVGGFVEAPSEDLYRRWLGFGVLTSHTRTHGALPREPWAYGEDFVDVFRQTVALKYALMPYIYAQAKASSAHGYPMLRTLFFEYPDDPTSWFIEDEYLFGSDLLVAPLFEEGNSRRVYLPPGSWIDYQTGEVYEGGQWHEITAGPIPVILLVENHSVIPHVEVTQSTSRINWEEVELRVFSTDGAPASGLFALPKGDLHRLEVESGPQGGILKEDPLQGKVDWEVVRAEGQ